MTKSEILQDVKDRTKKKNPNRQTLEDFQCIECEGMKDFKPYKICQFTLLFLGNSGYESVAYGLDDSKESRELVEKLKMLLKK